jgi:FtsH-binding integral membrane protein
MDAIIWTLGWLGFGSIVSGWGHYIATIPRDKVPRSPTIMLVTQPVGLIFAAVGLAFAIRAGSVPVGIMLLCGFAIFMGLFFFVLYSQRSTPLGNLRVELGSPMLAFEGVDSAGNAISTDDWRGRRILLKFYRGLW